MLTQTVNRNSMSTSQEDDESQIENNGGGSLVGWTVTKKELGCPREEKEEVCSSQ